MLALHPVALLPLAALLSFADEDECFARTRLTIEHAGSSAAKKGGSGSDEEEVLDKLRMQYDMVWALGMCSIYGFMHARALGM